MDEKKNVEICVRLTRIVIKDFKNVKHGEISFVNNSRKNFKSSITGVYGQNGSGKTALIDVLELLKVALCGMKVPDKFADFINVEASSAEIEYSFDINMSGKVYPTIYDIVLSRKKVALDDDIEQTSESTSRFHASISSELLKTKTETANGSFRMSSIINTKTSSVFIPKAKYDLLVDGNRETNTDLLVAKKIARKTSKSFIFSRELIDEIEKKASKEADKKNNECIQYKSLIQALAQFGKYELFVVNTSTSGLVSMNAQPLVFRMLNRKHGSLGTIAIPIGGPTTIPEEMFQVTEDVIDNMNIVLQTIVPGLTIGVKDLGNQLMPDGLTGKRVELVSRKNSREIPLNYESEGIKKIVSILQLLVVVYNQKSITVAIDELDSGVFEYLLGELLRIISEKGKGQLIFTSHNLRPLETLDRGFVAFTTTNPERRYIRLTNVKENNNLRDYYFRDIVLGGQKESIYDMTNNAEIAMAFREAGEYIGS